MTKTETREVALDDVRVMTNHRHHFDKAGMDELASNVRQFGVLEPLLVRRVDDELHLIAGARRLRAAKMAGLTMVRVNILDVDAATASEIQLLENIQRKGLEPIEEAEAFKTLLENGKHTVETLAERVDKSVAYVYRAIKLMDLPKGIIVAIEDGVLTPAHGHQILRAPEDQREELGKWALAANDMQCRVGNKLTVSDLRNHIDRAYGADLTTAIFPKNKAYAGEMACTGCPFNSGNQGNLFDGAEKGKCNNVPCYKKKTGAFMEEYSKAQAAEHPGLQYLGIQAIDYTGAVEGMKKATVINTPNAREVQKVMKANPDKFGWCVIAPRNGADKPTTTVVCLDRRILAVAKAVGAREDEPTAQPSGAPTAKERFVEEAIQQALEGAVEATIEPNKRFDYTDAQWGVISYAIYGADDWERKCKGVPKPDQARGLLVKLLFTLPDPTAALKDLGINIDKVKAAAAKKAESEWKAQGNAE